MRVLNLATSQDAEFFQLQVRALERQGVEGTTLGVPGDQKPTGDGMSSRSVADYLRFHTRVLRRSLDSYDVVHANYGLTAPAALSQPTRPVVLSLWGSDLLGEFGWLSRWCARRADAVIVMSEGMADALGTECHVVPHGVDLKRFRPFPRPAAREVVGWGHGARNVLFPYPERSEVKDYPRAERVVEAVRGRFDGDVELRTVYGVPHARMPLYVNAADALLLTSRREGSPNSVKEAMACNLPVVATDVGDVRERLDGVTPSYVCRTDGELVDGLLEVLERGTQSNGRAAVRSLGLERMGRDIREVYEGVLEERGASPAELGPDRSSA